MAAQGPQEVHTEEAWERYIEAERRELEMRQGGHLAKMLGAPLPDESPEELKRLVEEDQRRALEGLVELMSERGEITYNHINDITVQDRRARIRAEGKRIEWLTERMTRRPLPPPSLGPIGPADQ
jgi:hypothetical protein